MMAEKVNEELDSNVVALAIATTGLPKDGFKPEICQITLVNACSNKKIFSRHILPNGSFKEGASCINGFTIEVKDGKRCLMRDGNIVNTHSRATVLKIFHDEIANFHDQVEGRIVCIGYYCHDFDIPILIDEMAECGLSGGIFSKMNVVFADLYHLVRFKYSDLFPDGLENLRMTTVYNAICKTQELHKHDAMEDAKKLVAIYTHIKALVDKQTFERFVFSVNERGVQELRISTPPQRTSVKRDAESDTAELPYGLAKKKPKGFVI